MFKRAIVHYIERHTLVKQPLYDTFYKFFIVLSKDRIPEIEQKIANFDKKDTIKYIQDEFEKSWEGFKDKIYKQKA